MRQGAVLWGLVLTLALTGCGGEKTPVSTAPPTPVPAPAPGGPVVKTDWSKLGPHEREQMADIGARWYKDYTGTLIPRGDYGTLVPYVGGRLENSFMSGYQYGLMTMEGIVVVDPVYAAVSTARYGNGQANVLPVYVLRQGRDGGAGEEIQGRYAIAALDGSWSTDFDYEFAVPGPAGIFLVADDACMVMGTDGGIVSRWTWADLGYATGEKPAWCPGPMENIPLWRAGKVVLERADEYVELLDTRTGERPRMRFDDFWALDSEQESGDAWTVTPSGDTTVLTRENGRNVLPIPCLYGTAEGGYAILVGEDERSAAYTVDGKELVPPGRYEELDVQYDAVIGTPYLLAGKRTNGSYVSTILDADGKERVSFTTAEWSPLYPRLVNGLAETVTEDGAAYYDASGACVFRKTFALLPGED